MAVLKCRKSAIENCWFTYIFLYAFLMTSKEDIHEKRTGLSVTAHTLRHTHSAVLIMQNRSLKAISKRLGNSEEVLKSHYGHVIDSVDIDTMNAFSDALQDNPGADAGADLKNITEYR